MVKVVDVNTEEYRVNQELLRSPALFRDEPRGVIPPVAILLSPYNFAFIVMPR